jgi:hypothetical protein
MSEHEPSTQMGPIAWMSARRTLAR